MRANKTALINIDLLNNERKAKKPMVAKIGDVYRVMREFFTFLLRVEVFVHISQWHLFLLSSHQRMKTVHLES